jgi:hypothetical protein
MRARSTYGDIPGASLADWPIDYAELKRWYQVAEKRLGSRAATAIRACPHRIISR